MKRTHMTRFFIPLVILRENDFITRIPFKVTVLICSLQIFEEFACVSSFVWTINR